MCKLPSLSSRAAAAAQRILKAASSPCVDSKNLLIYAEQILCTDTSHRRSMSKHNSASLSHVDLILRNNKRLLKKDKYGRVPGNSNNHRWEKQGKNRFEWETKCCWGHLAKSKKPTIGKSTKSDSTRVRRGA